MRKTYQYNKKSDKPGEWGHSASEVLCNFVNYYENGYFKERRQIEDKIETISQVVGNLCDLLISKGLVNHEEFLQILELDKTHEGRDNIFSVD